MLAVLHVLKGIVLSCLGDYENMRLCIDSLFTKDQHPLNPMPDKIIKKMEPAEKYWNEVKNELIAYK